MVRKLALAVSFALGTLSVPAHALGLGELSSKSTLNQNFQGDITLLSVQPEELDAVRVKLADAEAFSRAGVDRPFYLSLLKFEPTLSSGGKAVIRVTSEFPIREPFMNFLIEVNWPKGRLLREYTVLLDPPTTTRRRPPAVAPVAKAAQSAPAARPVAPVAAAPAPQVASGVSAEGSEYGPVKANDTAWSIARQVRPRGVSMEQMMMALLAANPQAFLDGNINRLRRGQILRVPALAEIQEMTRQEARAAYRQQQDEWLARRDQKLQQAAKADATGETDAAAGTAEGGAAAETDDQLRIATARPEGSGEAGAGDDDALSPTASDLTSRLMVARENAETTRQEAESLRSRVDELQARLQDMQRLLSLKDEQLAQLQDRVATGETAGATETAADVSAEALPGSEPIADTAVVSEVEGAAVTAPDAVAEAEAPVAEAPLQAEADVPIDGSVEEPVVEPVVEMAAEEAVADSVGVTEGAAEGGATEMVAPAPFPDYTIEYIPRQIDPDRLVALSDAAGVVPEDALDAIPAEPVAAAEAEVAGGSDTVVPLEAGTPVTEPGDAVIIEGADGPATGMDAVAPVEQTGAVVEPPVMADEPVSLEPMVAEVPAEPADGESLIPAPLAEMLQQNMVPIAAGGVAVLGLVGWLAMRGRRKPEGGEPAAATAATAAAAGGAAGAATAVAETAEAVEESPPVDQPAIDADILADLPDSAFLDELSPGEINALQDETGEVDPVSEADVYIAYGRYQQAEELLRQAMNRDPDRLALRYKLLEVHYATRDADAFTALAQEMADAGQDVADAAAWARAQDMGRELVPGNALFTRSEGHAGVQAAAAAAGAAALADITLEGADEMQAEAEAEVQTVDHDTLSLDDLEISELNAAYAEEGTPVSELGAPSEVSITLDLDEASELQRPIEPSIPETIPLDEIEGMDFALPEAEKTPPGTEDVAVEEAAGDTLDLESMMAEAEAAVDQDESMMNLDSDFSAAELQAQLDELSDLSILDSDFDETAEASELEAPSHLGLVAEDTGIVVDGVDEPFSLDSELTPDEGDDEMPELLALNDEGVSGEPVSEDEVATKLDLARAYVDMGDDDGARSILEEVVEEGTDSQRGDAEQLLAKIG